MTTEQNNMLTEIYNIVSSNDIISGSGSGSSYNIGSGYKYVAITSLTGTFSNSVGSGSSKTYNTDISYNSSTGLLVITCEAPGTINSWTYIAIK